MELAQWHTVVIKRDGKEGSLVVDAQDPIYGQSEGSFQGLDVNGILYVGGLPSLGASLPSALQFLGNDVGLYGKFTFKQGMNRCYRIGQAIIIMTELGNM